MLSDGEAETRDDDATPLEGIFFSFLETRDGCRYRIASNVRQLNDPASGRHSNTLLWCLHGFPESWYSWRHQLLYWKNHDPRVCIVAPDMRGYGSSDQPVDENAYTQPILAQHMMELIQQCSPSNNMNQECIIIGHDWGAMLAWNIALLYPESIAGVLALSVPYMGIPQQGLLTVLQKTYGQCLDPHIPRAIRAKARFHYILHHCLPNSAQIYNQRTEQVLHAMYAGIELVHRQQSNEEENMEQPPAISSPLMFTPEAIANPLQPLDATVAPGFWERVFLPRKRPSWLSAFDWNYYVREFQRSGFHGGLAWYKAADRNADEMRELMKEKGDHVRIPALFLIGEQDSVLTLYGGWNKIQQRMPLKVPLLVQPPVLVPHCGHWIQQEHPTLVNHAMKDFVRQVVDASEHTTRSKL